MNLVIVESPAKSKTIKKYLGKDFEVLASYGHVRDLIPKQGAVEPGDGFRMRYEMIKKNAQRVKQITAALKKSTNLYLATDPDREGEAIAWHLAELLKEKGLTEGKGIYRVVFYEVTKNAVQEAFAKPRTLSQSLVDAQQARRALDYLVGFNLSPLLWRKLQSGLSAGRVQSPALGMIVGRELQIEEFKSREYWTILASLEKEAKQFTSRLYAIGGSKVEQFDIADAKVANKVREGITASAKDGVSVVKVEKKQRRRKPAPPFITSTLQQEAIRKLGFSASQTMRVAQQLYEGIDLGEGAAGLITYMRTDSVVLSDAAVTEIRKYVSTVYGAECLPQKPPVYKTKSKNAQEAHEAIRPTLVTRVPKDLATVLDNKQLRLYELIWKRTVACQMAPAIFDVVAADIGCGDYLLRATGRTLREPGFMQVYTESGEENKDHRQDDADDRQLLPLEQGDLLKLCEVEAEQHFTEPPPRYSEASLISMLEEHGIGRPSTYASIIATLQNREYTILEKKRFHPTDTGTAVNRFLTDHFKQYVDYQFTADLENELDEIARGERGWVSVMEDFWKPFSRLIEEKNESVTRAEAWQARELGVDPKSGKPVSTRLGRYGPFVQLGTREDEEKPKFASLKPGQKSSTITLEEALDLFKLPRSLGETLEGEPLQAGSGRFGAFIKYGNSYVSLKEEDPFTVTRERALELVDAKRKADQEKIIRVFDQADVKVLKGRYGPYVTDGDKNAKIPADRVPDELTLEECQELIKQAPSRKSRGRKSGAKTKKKTRKTSAKAKGESVSLSKTAIASEE